MCLWAMNREPSMILLISDDKRFTWTVSELCNKANFEILLAHRGEDPKELTSEVTRALLWNNIASCSTCLR